MSFNSLFGLKRGPYFLARRSKSGSQINGGRSFSYATFLIAHGNDACRTVLFELGRNWEFLLREIHPCLQLFLPLAYRRARGCEDA
ncbi:MAG: hypothetical protein RL230_1866, partial [Pseudomonadota bacterium]